MSARLISAVALAALAAALLAPAPAAAESDCEAAPPSFGLCGLDVTITDSGGTPALLAGSHPFAVKGKIAVKTEEAPSGQTVPVEEAKDLKISFPPGMVANPTAVPSCSAADFLAGDDFNDCAPATQVGIAKIEFGEPGFTLESPVFNLVPSPGAVAKIGFIVFNRGVVSIELGLNPNPPYNGQVLATNITEALFFFSSEITVWGVPADPAHDSQRGRCLEAGGSCPTTVAPQPFLTLPTSCEGPLRTDFEADSWQEPGLWVKAPPVFSHDDSDPPNPLGTGGCDKLAFAPQTAAKPSSDQAESPSGLDFELNVDDQGLTNPTGASQSVIKKAAVTLPAGVTVNPSVAEGLATCSPAQLEAETLASEPGEGCPQASKVGTVEVETPILEEKLLKGSLFIATQDDPATSQPGAENPFDSLIALYMVVKDPGLGILVKLPMKVEPDEEAGPNAGRLVATLGEPGYEIPQIAHISHFRLHLREGGRSPLITPAHCGTYATEAVLTPWSDPSKPLESTSSFQITRGVGGGPCPPAGPPPFAPGFAAGTINNDAKSFSPFYMRLTRRDGDQDLTKVSAAFPPGVLGTIAGVSKCSEAQIATAKAKGGRAELASPSCPANSQIGRTLAGAGVGSQLTYVPGKLYLAGPYKGDPLSVVSITPAVAGPFDVGNVVVRFALTLNPINLQVEVDGSASDPIPHILKGIVLKVRDLRVYADRDRFTFNPTNCEPSEAKATLFGSFANVFDPSDDAPVSLTDRFQAANCASLGFKPKLSLSLKGGTQRGDHPAFKAVVTPRPNDANFAQTIITLPHSAFLDQAHIRTICTRVQFAAKACPQAAIYGFAKAWTPLVDEPAEGPVYLRSSNHKLPDLVMALKGPPSAEVDFDLAGRIDSHKGGIRGSFETIPDVPVSKFVLTMQGGKKGLIVNSRGLCAHSSPAIARLLGQNGRRYDSEPLLRPLGCKGKATHKRRQARH